MNTLSLCLSAGLALSGFNESDLKTLSAACEPKAASNYVVSASPWKSYTYTMPSGENIQFAMPGQPECHTEEGVLAIATVVEEQGYALIVAGVTIPEGVPSLKDQLEIIQQMARIEELNVSGILGERNGLEFLRTVIELKQLQGFLTSYTFMTERGLYSLTGFSSDSTAGSYAIDQLFDSFSFL